MLIIIEYKKIIFIVFALLFVQTMSASAYVGFSENFTSEPNPNISIWHSATLPLKGVDYGMYSDGNEEVMWIMTNDNVSREYIDGMYYFNPMVDLSRFPILSYSLEVSDGSVIAGIDYMEVSNGSGSIKIWEPDSFYSSTSWVNRSFDAYNIAMSKGDYRYLKSIGLMLRENSVGLNDGKNHYVYWDYVTASNNLTATCIGNCYNPDNIFKEDGFYTRIYNDNKNTNTNAVIMDLGRDVTVSGINVKFYNNFSKDTGFFEDFASEPNPNINLWHPATLPLKGIDYDMYSDGKEEVMWILTDDNVSREYIDGMYYFNPMVDLSKFPILSYSLKDSDGNIGAGIEYMEVSNGSGSIKIWGPEPDSFYSSTSWLNRSFNAYDIAMSKGNYKYLKSIGLMMRENSVGLNDGKKHYTYWDYVMISNENFYSISVSNDKKNWMKIKTDKIFLKPNQSNIVSIDNIWEYSDLSDVRYIKTESLKGNLWIDSIKTAESPFWLISTTSKINLISVDNDSYTLVTPDIGKATYTFKAPALSKLRVTDNTKVVINYNNGAVFKEPGWGINYNNQVITLDANLSKNDNYIMLDFNPQPESIQTGNYGSLRNESDVNYFINSNLDWFWYQSSYNQKAIYAKNLTSKGKKVLLRVWWWDNPELINTNWTDLYYNQNLLNLAINDAISQIDAVGIDSFYAICLSEEEPNAGYEHNSWYYDGNGANTIINQAAYVTVNNKIYDAIKAKYPSIKILDGVWIMSLSDANLANLKRDGIVDDMYSPLSDMNTWYNKLILEQKNHNDTYLVIWAGSNFSGYEAYTPSYTQQAFELGKNKGLKNIGFFDIALPYQNTISFNDYDVNPGLPSYQRPELYKEEIAKIVNKNSIK